MTGTKSPVGERPSRPASAVTLLEISKVRDTLGFILTSARISSMVAPWAPLLRLSALRYLGGAPTEGRPYRFIIFTATEYHSGALAVEFAKILLAAKALPLFFKVSGMVEGEAMCKAARPHFLL